jgi:hypothetical protein
MEYRPNIHAKTATRKDTPYTMHHASWPGERHGSSLPSFPWNSMNFHLQKVTRPGLRRCLDPSTLVRGVPSLHWQPAANQHQRPLITKNAAHSGWTTFFCWITLSVSARRRIPYRTTRILFSSLSWLFECPCLCLRSWLLVFVTFYSVPHA